MHKLILASAIFAAFVIASMPVSAQQRVRSATGAAGRTSAARSATSARAASPVQARVAGGGTARMVGVDSYVMTEEQQAAAAEAEAQAQARATERQKKLATNKTEKERLAKELEGIEKEIEDVENEIAKLEEQTQELLK